MYSQYSTLIIHFINATFTADSYARDFERTSLPLYAKLEAEWRKGAATVFDKLSPECQDMARAEHLRLTGQEYVR